MEFDQKLVGVCIDCQQPMALSSLSSTQDVAEFEKNLDTPFRYKVVFLSVGRGVCNRCVKERDSAAKRLRYSTPVLDALNSR